MEEEHPEVTSIEEALLAEGDEFASFESGSLVREIKKAVVRGDDEIALILTRALCEKSQRNSFPHQSCIIYCRVSTEQQALGTGLLRQMQVCSDYARQKDYWINGIFSEVASGAGDLPVRALVERIAIKKQCLILCEDYSRWSRKGESDLPPAWVIMTSEAMQKLNTAMKRVLEQYKESANQTGAA